MPQKINFSDYNASGVYFLEIDNSIITSSNVRTALRLAVGFNMQGPFNRPIFISDSSEVDRLLGGIDRKLERKGCFTNRNVRTMIEKAPTYVLNLLNVDTKDSSSNKDTVGLALMNLNAGNGVAPKESKALYAQMYDRTKFWVADDNAFVNNTFEKTSKEVDASVNSINESMLFGVSNCGTKDFSVIVRKSENVTGYNVTFLEYYGNEDSIPYSWINKYDYVSDYFVDVYAIAGDWSSSNYASFATDPLWGDYFDATGLKKDMLNRFLRLDAVNVIGTWTGCILPNFMDKQGNSKSIDYLVNKTCNETGVMFGVNEGAMEYISLDGSTFFFDEDGDGVYDSTVDTVAYFKPDFVGHTIKSSDSSIAYKYMSCNINTNGKVKSVSATAGTATTEFVCDASVGADINVGDFVRATNGLMTKIVKKRGYKENDDDKYKFTAVDSVKTNGGSVEVHKAYSDMYNTLTLYTIKGLKLCNRHMPGFDSNGAIDYEKGVEKIYAMLEDTGIRKGLLNNDAMDFRYIVDTLAYGLKENCGGKKYLANLAKEKKHCTAIINAPSMSQFANSDEPFFGETYNKNIDGRPTFDVKYIPEGGNQDMIYSANTESFTLPSQEFGADHTGVFAPYLKYTDGTRTILVPPAADVSNVFMNKFIGGDPYVTVANTNGVLSNANISGVEYTYDETDRGYLEPFGINPIIERGGAVMIYGDRTAFQAYNSDLSFMHVRELLNTIQINCKSVLDDYVFTYNTPVTRAEIVTRINPILSAMQDSGALVKYEIECDEFNNTKDVIDNKFCIVDIGVWISQNMEKIVVPITINRSTTA